MRKKNIRLGIVLLWFLGVIIITPSIESYAATDEAKEEFREIVIEMFRTGDASKKDISNLKLTFKEHNAIYLDVINNECWLEYGCCINVYPQNTSYTENGNVYTKYFYLMNMDSKLPEYTAKANKHIQHIKSQIDAKMTDLDKLVLIHDYIDRITIYDLDAEHGHIHSAMGPLYYGSSVCDGYAKAMNLLLRAVGVETKSISNSGHGWSLVKIDGEYYHVDPTWDDTRCYITGTYKTHYFMMRNDNEYINDTHSPHTGFGEYDSVTGEYITTFSTSTKYVDWYVHSIVGDMYYHDGEWYYVQDGNIVRNKINGTMDTWKTVVSGNGITLVGIEDNDLLYREDSVDKTISLDTLSGGSGESTDPGNGNESGSGESTDPGNGNGSGESTDPGNGNGSGESIDSGNGNGSGESTDPGNGNGSGESTDPENGNGTEKDKKTEKIIFKDKKSKGYYQILSKGKKTGTVAYIKPYESAKGKVTIPNTIKKDGITYKVTEIGAGAFKNNKKITGITVNKNVKMIGSKAFYKCKKLKTITINTKKLTSDSVKKTAFKGISNKVTVKVVKSKYDKYKKLLVSKGLKSKKQIMKN